MANASLLKQLNNPPIAYIPLPQPFVVRGVSQQKDALISYSHAAVMTHIACHHPPWEPPFKFPLTLIYASNLSHTAQDSPPLIMGWPTLSALSISFDSPSTHPLNSPRLLPSSADLRLVIAMASTLPLNTQNDLSILHRDSCVVPTLLHHYHKTQNWATARRETMTDMQTFDFAACTRAWDGWAPTKELHGTPPKVFRLWEEDDRSQTNQSAPDTLAPTDTTDGTTSPGPEILRTLQHDSPGARILHSIQTGPHPVQANSPGAQILRSLQSVPAETDTTLTRATGDLSQ